MIDDDAPKAIYEVIAIEELRAIIASYLADNYDRIYNELFAANLVTSEFGSIIESLRDIEPYIFELKHRAMAGRVTDASANLDLF